MSWAAGLDHGIVAICLKPKLWSQYGNEANGAAVCLCNWSCPICQMHEV